MEHFFLFVGYLSFALGFKDVHKFEEYLNFRKLLKNQRQEDQCLALKKDKPFMIFGKTKKTVKSVLRRNNIFLLYVVILLMMQFQHFNQKRED